jgi:hypothetical protein
MMSDACGAICEIGAMVGLLATLAFDGWGGPPSDQEMIANFHENRAHFEALREKMCQLSHRQLVWADANRPLPPLPEDELRWYRETLATIGATRVAAVPNPCRISITEWAVGLAGSGEYKQYRLGPSLHEPMIEASTLDDVDRASPEVTFWHRRIEEDWWLEFERWP